MPVPGCAKHPSHSPGLVVSLPPLPPLLLLCRHQAANSPRCYIVFQLPLHDLAAAAAAAPARTSPEFFQDVLRPLLKVKLRVGPFPSSSPAHRCSPAGVGMRQLYDRLRELHSTQQWYAIWFWKTGYPVFRRYKNWCTGGQLFMMSKVQCLFCSKYCTTEGRGGEKGGSANTKAKHTEPLTSELISPLYRYEMTPPFHEMSWYK